MTRRDAIKGLSIAVALPALGQYMPVAKPPSNIVQLGQLVTPDNRINLACHITNVEAGDGPLCDSIDVLMRMRMEGPSGVHYSEEGVVRLPGEFVLVMEEGTYQPGAYKVTYQFQRFGKWEDVNWLS